MLSECQIMRKLLRICVDFLFNGRRFKGNLELYSLMIWDFFLPFPQLFGVYLGWAPLPKFKLLLPYKPFQLADTLLQAVNIVIGFSHHFN